MWRLLLQNKLLCLANKITRKTFSWAGFVLKAGAQKHRGSCRDIVVKKKTPKNIGGTWESVPRGSGSGDLSQTVIVSGSLPIAKVQEGAGRNQVSNFSKTSQSVGAVPWYPQRISACFQTLFSVPPTGVGGQCCRSSSWRLMPRAALPALRPLGAQRQVPSPSPLLFPSHSPLPWCCCQHPRTRGAPVSLHLGCGGCTHPGLWQVGTFPFPMPAPGLAENTPWGEQAGKRNVPALCCGPRLSVATASVGRSSSPPGQHIPWQW